MAKHFSTSLIASGKTWDEIEEDMRDTGYTGTTWMVYFYDNRCSGDYVAKLFTDLNEAKAYATSITREQLLEWFAGDLTHVMVQAEEDEWIDGQYTENGFCTVYGFDWTDDGWVPAV